MTKPVGLMLLIAGLILGPGYFTYTRSYSGREITELPLAFHTGTDGRSRAVANFDLLPVMGPVTVIVYLTSTHGPVNSPPALPRNRYQARVTLGDKTVLTYPFSVRALQVEATPAEVFKQALPVMKNLVAGDYKLELTQQGEAGMEIRHAAVQVRAGVKYVNITLLAIGLVLLFAGVVVILFAP